MLKLDFIENEMEIIMKDSGSRRAQFAKILLEVNLRNSIEDLEKEIEKIKNTTANLNAEEKEALKLYNIYENEINHLAEELDNCDNNKISEIESLIDYYTDLKEKIAIENNLKLYFKAKIIIKMKEGFITEYKYYLNKLKNC